MAVTNPPYVAQGRTDHPAVLFRMALAGVAGGPAAVGVTAPAGGVNPILGQRLLPTGLATMAVQIGTGLCYVPNSTAWNGMYGCYNTATSNVNIAASSSTQWRRDYIVAQVTDPGDNTAAWALNAVTGTFSSSAPGALPTIPANAIPLAIVNVVPNMSVTSGAGTVVDARPWQPLSGPFPTTSSNRPALSAPEGTMWVETDTHLLGIIINGAYQYIPFGSAVSAWQTMSLINGWTSQGGSAGPCRFKLMPSGDVFIQGELNSSGASSRVFCQLPVGFRPATGTQPFWVSRTATTDFNFGTCDTSGNLLIAGDTIATAVYVFSGLITLA